MTEQRDVTQPWPHSQWAKQVYNFQSSAAGCLSNVTESPYNVSMNMDCSVWLRSHCSGWPAFTDHTRMTGKGLRVTHKVRWSTTSPTWEMFLLQSFWATSPGWDAESVSSVLVFWQQLHMHLPAFYWASQQATLNLENEGWWTPH